MSEHDERIQAIGLRPGDVLVVHVDPNWRPTEYERGKLYQMWGDVGQRYGADSVVVSQGSVGIDVIRPETTTDSD